MERKPLIMVDTSNMPEFCRAVAAMQSVASIFQRVWNTPEPTGFPL